MKIKRGQSFLDIVLESTGNRENFILMAHKNNVSITDVLNIGTEIQVTGKKKKRIIEMFGENNIPASLTNNDNVLDFLFPNLFPISL